MASAWSIIAWSSTASLSTASAERRSPTSRWRAGLRIGALVGWFLLCAPLHFGSKLLLRRSGWPRRFLGGAAWIAGARARVEGTPVAPHTLLLANHLSWLDILVLCGATGCTFVSKDELGHPLVHWLADQNHTVYVRRTHRKGARDQALAVAKALDGMQPVALFPEGTTGPGTHLLPLRSTLLEAAKLTSRDIAIRPVALDYHDVAQEISWHEEPASSNVPRVLGRRGTFAVTIKLLPALEPGGDRKQLAEQARAALVAALGFKFAAHSPIAEGE